MGEFTNVDYKFSGEEITLNQEEYKIHVNAVKNLRVNFPGLRFFHIPNRPSDGADGHFKKEMGARAGASDLLFSWNNPNWEMGYQQENGKLEVGIIEIKAHKGVFRTDQNKFMSSYSLIGWRTAIAKTYRQIHDALLSWGLRAKCSVMTEAGLRTAAEKKQQAFDMMRPL